MPPAEPSAAISLAHGTGVPATDRVVRGLVGLTENLFPGLVVGYYLYGSHADGTAVAASDLDLLLIVRPDAARGQVDRVKAVYRWCDQVSPVPVGAIVVTPAEAVRYGFAGWAREAKWVYGADIAAGWPEPPAGRRLAFQMGMAFGYAGRLFQARPPVPVPLPAPAPADPWLGLVGGAVRHPDGVDRPGTKRLAGAVLTAAQALVSVRAGRWVAGKGEAVVAAYRDAVGGEWVELVAAAHRRCRVDWGYLVPAGEAERAELRRICEQAVGFVNEFARAYHAFLLAERGSTDPGRAQFAAARLAELVIA